MFTASDHFTRLQEEAVVKEISQWTHNERISLLYAAICRNIESSQAQGFPPEDFTEVAGLVYYDRKHRLADVPFPTTKDELSAIFAELDQDQDTNHFLDWLAKNLPRFSRIGLHKPSMVATLKDSRADVFSGPSRRFLNARHHSSPYMCVKESFLIPSPSLVENSRLPLGGPSLRISMIGGSWVQTGPPIPPAAIFQD